MHSAILLFGFITACGSTPDDEGMIEPGGGTGGELNNTGGSAVDASGGFGTGGDVTGTGGSGASDSGGTSATGGASATGGVPNTGGAVTTGGTTSTGGAASTGGAEGSGGCSSEGEIKFVASFDASVNESLRPGLSTCIKLAGELWSERLSVPFDVTLEVLVSYDPSIFTADCRSSTTVAWESGDNVYELSAAHEIRTGVDPNGATVDIQMRFGNSLIDGTYWFDPDPNQRNAPIPSGKIDVLSTCTHELGHAIGFSGARSTSTGNLPGYSFLYDEHATLVGNYYYFMGTEAEVAYGAEVPLNTQVFGHLGNVSPAPGYDLDLDLMHGTPTRYQQRYYPTAVNDGILADLGLPVKGTPAAAAVCNALQSQAKTLGSPKLGPKPPFVE